MVSTQFGAILKELEPFFKCPLVPDQNNSCLIHMGIGISIQLELDRYGFLLIGCRVATLPMNRYRDNIIQQAMKSNDADLPSTGVFGFGHKTSHLILFLRLDPSNTSPHQILALLPPYIAKAKKWNEAIAKGEMPSIEGSVPTKTSSGMFGLS
jgi:hypothetical protein